MASKKMTIEDLAVMVQRGFEETATKGELADFREEVNERFDGIDQRLEKIENILIAGHDRRIERLEDSMRQVLTAVKI